MGRHRAPAVCPRHGCPNDQPCPTHTPPPWAGSNQRRPDALRGRALQARNARILRRDGHRCQATTHHPQCDGTGNEVDHIVAYADGGTDHDTNLCAINTLCNALKARTDGRTTRTR
jgi:5-methylcytosine-specific restriction enzyme A